MNENRYDEVMRRIQSRWVLTGVAPGTEEDIRRVEQEIGHELPTDYRHFLAKYGFSAGEPYVGYGDFDNPECVQAGTRVGVFYGAGISSDHGILSNYRFQHELLDMPVHLLPIANSEGDQICLSLAESDFGQVYLCVQPSLQTGNPEEDIIPIAKDFDTFVRSLRRVDTGT
jgi:cell wall assembly regulator SMI1